MLGFIGLLSACTKGSFGESLAFSFKGPIKCVSLSNQLCQDRPTPVDINSNKILFHLFIVSVNKCDGSCSTIDDWFGRVCVPNKAKNMNIRVLNLMSGVNERRFLVHHESCKCKCRLNKSSCNSKQKSNYNECRCECKELVLAKVITCGILARVIVNAIKHVKLMNI